MTHPDYGNSENIPICFMEDLRAAFFGRCEDGMQSFLNRFAEG